jgi:transcription initiation factor TFIIA large subunit
MEEGVVLTSVNAQGEVEMGRVEIDNLIREHIEAKGRAMEGGGLMLPLKEHFPAGRNKKRKVAVHKSSNAALGQTDGVEDDDDDKSGILKDEEDEDAINSDLDDPDDDLKDDDEDEDLGHIMLCMYDKVQRVKNKW